MRSNKQSKAINEIIATSLIIVTFYDGGDDDGDEND